MSLFQLALIALIQGITEWLPISSSGHILILTAFFDIRGEDELLINAMAHLGTLFAILVYFRADVVCAVRGGLELLSRTKSAQEARSADARLALLILAALPIALLITAAYTQLPEPWLNALRSIWVVAGGTIFFALILWWADVKGASQRQATEMTLREAAIIGAVQAIAAIIPGTSRSGITMTAARALGFSRTESARFSMLIGAPLLAAGGLYAFFQLYQAAPGTIALNLGDGFIVMGLSFLSALASIWMLMTLLEKISFLPFVVYRIILGGAILIASPLGLGWIGG